MSMIIDGTNGLTFNNATTQASAGNVLQVVQATTTTSVTNLTTTYADTNLTATITPKFATSKILITVNQAMYVYDTTSVFSAQAGIQIVRNSTAVFNNGNKEVFGFYYPGASARMDIEGIITYSYLDSPATTSAITYKTQGALNQGGTGESVIFQSGSGASLITLMEIAA